MAVKSPPDTAIVEHLETALQNSRAFCDQTQERVNSMKLEVLHTYKTQDNGDINKYDKNITTRIINLVEARTTALEHFKTQQQEAEQTLDGLRVQLKNSTSLLSQDTQQGLAIRNQRDEILKHVSRIQQLRKEQLEAEGLLNKFLELKTQAQAQDRDALRISQEIKIMESKLDGFGMDEKKESTPLKPEAALSDNQTNVAGRKYQTANPELQRFMFNDVPPPNAPCVVLGDVVSPQGVAFKARDQVQFIRAGTKGWTLIRDRHGVPSWLPAFEVQALHTNQGLLDYRDVSQNGAGGHTAASKQGSAEPVRTTFFNQHRASPQGVAALRGTLPPLQTPPAPHQDGRSGGQPSESPQQETPAAPQASPAVDGAVPAGHNGVVGLALSTGAKDEVVVAAIKPGGPASQAQSIEVGQAVTRIGEVEIGGAGAARRDLAEVVRMLCGPAGSFVSLSLCRPDGKELEVVLTRQEPNWQRARDNLKPPGPAAAQARSTPPAAPPTPSHPPPHPVGIRGSDHSPGGSGRWRGLEGLPIGGPGPGHWHQDAQRPPSGSPQTQTQTLRPTGSPMAAAPVMGVPHYAGPADLQWAAGGSARHPSPAPEPADPPDSPVASPLVPPEMGREGTGSPPRPQWWGAHGHHAHRQPSGGGGADPLDALDAGGAGGGGARFHRGAESPQEWGPARGVSPGLVYPLHTGSPVIQNTDSPMLAPPVAAFPSVVGGAFIPQMPPVLPITPQIADNVPSVAGWGFPEGQTSPFV